MTRINDEIFLRRFDPEMEMDFWREVFFDSIGAQFSGLALAENQINQLLEIQFRAQCADYQKNYPNSASDVILYREMPAGRVIISTEHDDLRLIDIAVLSRFRNRGIGTAIMRWLFTQSRETGLPVRFHVEKANPALRLYERLGFKIIADLTTHFQMEWREEALSIS